MRYLFLRENMLFEVNIRFHLPKPHWTPYDVYTKYFFIIGVSALTIVGAIHSTKLIQTGPTGKSRVYLKKWTSFFETFPVGPNRSFEFWTEIPRHFGWMDRAPWLGLGWFLLSPNFSMRTCVKFAFTNKIEAMYERSRVRVKVESRSTSRLISTIYILFRSYLRD